VSENTLLTNIASNSVENKLFGFISSKDTNLTSQPLFLYEAYEGCKESDIKRCV